MLLRNNPTIVEGKQDNNSSRKIWYTKKEAMQFFDVCRTVFYGYRKHHGLKTCGRGHAVKFHIDDMEDFLWRHRK